MTGVLQSDMTAFTKMRSGLDVHNMGITISLALSFFCSSVHQTKPKSFQNHWVFFTDVENVILSDSVNKKKKSLIKS